MDSQDKAPRGNLLIEIRVGRVELELYKEYVWKYPYGESWGSQRWREATLLCAAIDTQQNAYILPYLLGEEGEENYQEHQTTKAYYVDIPDDAETTKIRIALYIKSVSTTLWAWWHKALEKEEAVPTSGWVTLYEKKEVRHIDLGFYEEWLYTEAWLEYAATPYIQEFTKTYMVTKQGFVARPDTEYVVVALRVDSEFRTIVCPREIFLETRLGDLIMETRKEELGELGLGDANISGFAEGKISLYMYGLGIPIQLISLILFIVTPINYISKKVEPLLEGLEAIKSCRIERETP